MIVCYRIHIITYYSSLITNFKGVTTYIQNNKKKKLIPVSIMDKICLYYT